MAVVAYYERKGESWLKVAKSTSPRAEEDTPFSIERDRKTGYWGIWEQDGSLLAACVDRKSAERMVKKLRASAYSSRRIKKRASLIYTQKRWVIQYCVGYCPKMGNPYSLKFSYTTREEAEASLQRH